MLRQYQSLRKVSGVCCPTLVVCGAGDALVPPGMARRLLQRCGAARKRLLVLPGGGHDDTWTRPDYYPALQAFLRDAPALPAPPPALVHTV